MATPGLDSRLHTAVGELRRNSAVLARLPGLLERLEAAIRGMQSPGQKAALGPAGPPEKAPDGTIAEQPVHSGQIPEGPTEAPSAPSRTAERSAPGRQRPRLKRRFP